MDISKLRTGEKIAAVAGILLLIDMFLSWYGIGGALGGSLGADVAKAAGVDTTANAWQSFDFIDLLLFVLVVVAIGQAALTASGRSVALPVAASVVVTALGVLMTLLVFYRLINEPGPDKYIDIKFGAYLGFLLCAAIAAGGFLSMQDEGTSFSQAAAQVQGGSTATTTGTAAPPPPATTPPPPPPPPPAEEPPSAPPPGGGAPPTA
jgi:hypothetical protein